MILKTSGTAEPRDPWVIYEDGYFYHCFANRAGDIFVAKSQTAEGLATASPVLAYRPEEGKPYSKELWAPELHILDGKSYIYVACDDGNNHNHRMYVLTNDSADPTKVPYRMGGKLTDDSDKWAIDATIFHYNGKRYVVWSGWEGDENVCQNLYIATMSDPFTITSKRVCISTPEYDWEKLDCDGNEHGKGPYINEGPAVYQKDGELMVLYSGSGSWANNYCIGILRFKGGDLLDKNNWEKQPFPALSQADGWNGPGHCSVCSDGKKDYIAFHVYDDDKTYGWDNVHAVFSPFELKEGKIIVK